MPLHETKKTLSLNEARNFIVAMSKPMGEAVELIDKSSKEIEKVKEINALTSVKDKKEKFIAELEKRIEEYTEEKEILYKCSFHFGAFLKQNAMIAFNDSCSEYLDMLIKDEQTKEEVDKDRIDQLMEDKRTYEEKKEIIIREISSPDSEGKVIRIEMIYEMRDKLCSLKHNGKNLKEALGTVNFSKL